MEALRTRGEEGWFAFSLDGTYVDVLIGTCGGGVWCVGTEGEVPAYLVGFCVVWIEETGLGLW